jgi:hypothetical protein
MLTRAQVSGAKNKVNLVTAMPFVSLRSGGRRGFEVVALTGFRLER